MEYEVTLEELGRKKSEKEEVLWWYDLADIHKVEELWTWVK